MESRLYGEIGLLRLTIESKVHIRVLANFPGSRTVFPGKRECQKSGNSQEFPVPGFPADSTTWDHDKSLEIEGEEKFSI